MIGERLAQLAEATDTAIVLLRRERRIEEVAQAVLEGLAQAARCEWGAYWALDPPSQRLQAVASWSALGSQGARFEQDARVRTLASNQGNAGQVWRSRKPIWTTNLVLDMCLPRSLDASEAGLRGGVWFAVKTDTAIYGVIELLARVLPYKNAEALMAVERAGFRLGYVLEEVRSEPSRLH
jgi:hypothetical protein